MPYCSTIGLSRPYFASRFWRISSETALSLESGSPGMLCIARKVAVAMNQTVMTPWMRRLMV